MTTTGLSIEVVSRAFLIYKILIINIKLDGSHSSYMYQIYKLTSLFITEAADHKIFSKIVND